MKIGKLHIPAWGVIAIVVAVAMAEAAVRSPYRLGIDTGEFRCLHEQIFLVRLGTPTLAIGNLVALETRGLEPHFEDGTLFTKVVQGMPGDVVERVRDGFIVNGKHFPFHGVLVDRIGADTDALTSYTLGPDEFFVAGTEARSYDSRYYGPVKREQMVGWSKALW